MRLFNGSFTCTLRQEAKFNENGGGGYKKVQFARNFECHQTYTCFIIHCDNQIAYRILVLRLLVIQSTLIVILTDMVIKLINMLIKYMSNYLIGNLFIFFLFSHKSKLYFMYHQYCTFKKKMKNALNIYFISLDRINKCLPYIFQLFSHTVFFPIQF